MYSRIPRIALTDKSAALQTSKFVKTTEKVMRPVAFRQEIAENVAKRFNPAGRNFASVDDGRMAAIAQGSAEVKSNSF